MTAASPQHNAKTVAHQFVDLMSTARPVAMHPIDIWRVVDGIVVEHGDRVDGQAFFAQLTVETGGR